MVGVENVRFLSNEGVAIALLFGIGILLLIGGNGSWIGGYKLSQF
ncbi:MAG: hypothetical protein V3V68_04985 [Nitrosomonadaceae bacterium]